MTVKRYFVFPKAPALLEPHYQIVINRTVVEGGPYPSAEKQSVYSTAPANWVTGHSLEQFYPSAEMQSVYSTAPTDWAEEI